ncbi:hypothetical protein [Jeotgalibaca porci]|uniref:hypothetical protein n=1 Tax=Jeotgalibaca porci TaxID=1868793 RepID=UPI0035A14D26
MQRWYIFDAVIKNELKQSADYTTYKLDVDNPVPKLKYWKTLRSDLEDVIEKEILPLQRR